MFLRNKKQKFSIRKLSAGAASVLVAASVLGGAVVNVHAEDRINSDINRRIVDKKDAENLRNAIIAKGARLKNDSEVISFLREALSNATVDTLATLLSGIDPARFGYSNSQLEFYSRHLGSLIFRSFGLATGFSKFKNIAD